MRHRERERQREINSREGEGERERLIAKKVSRVGVNAGKRKGALWQTRVEKRKEGKSFFFCLFFVSLHGEEVEEIKLKLSLDLSRYGSRIC